MTEGIMKNRWRQYETCIRVKFQKGGSMLESWKAKPLRAAAHLNPCRNITNIVICHLKSYKQNPAPHAKLSYIMLYYKIFLHLYNLFILLLHLDRER